MRWFRFKIRSIIGLIVICGVALAALKESTDLWEKGVFSFTLLILLLSVLFAVHRRGASQAFWLGFALFGSVYLGLSLIPPIESRLISSQGLGYLHYRLPGQSAQNVVLTITTPTVGTMNVPTGSIASSPGGGQGQLASRPTDWCGSGTWAVAGSWRRGEDPRRTSLRSAIRFLPW